jgi:Flp pilus assembly protein TadG
MVAFTAIVSLVVDLAHVRVVKNQLQLAADSAARNAASGLYSGKAAQNAAATAAYTTIDGTAVSLQNSDIVPGTWSNGTFTAGGASPNAVKIIAQRSAARGNGVQVWWGGLMGKTQADVTASSIAQGTPTILAGFIGYANVTFKNNSFIGSYSSATNKNPNQANAGNKARVGTNGSIVGQNNNIIDGDAVLGPGATISGTTVQGSTDYQSSAIPAPTMPSWSPPGSPTALVVSSNTVMPGGTYWFSSMNVTANLTFSGPTTIYVNGDAVITCTLAAASGNPKDLVVYQYGAHSFGDTPANGMVITADVIAPQSDFAAKNNLTFYGSGVFNSITTWNNANFYYDTQLGPADGTPIISTVQ